MNEIFVYLYFTLNDTEKLLEYICNENLFNMVDKDLANKFCSRLECSYITIFDREYYKIIDDLENPPLVLFYKGNINILKNDNVLIVGEDKMSNYGYELLNDIIKKTNKNIIITNNNFEFNKKVITKSKLYNKKVILVGNTSISTMERRYNLNNSLIISFNIKKSRKLNNNFKLLHLIKNIVIIETSKNLKINALINYAVERNINIMVAPGRIYDFKMYKNNLLISEGATILNFNDL